MNMYLSETEWMVSALSIGGKIHSSTLVLVYRVGLGLFCPCPFSQSHGKCNKITQIVAYTA